MYTVKRGVALFMSAEIEKMLSVMVPLYRAFKIPLVITSGLDGPHRADSLHYRFRAIDVRKNFDNMELTEGWETHGEAIIKAMRERFAVLKYPVDIVDERDHVHIEWDIVQGHKTKGSV